MRSAACFGLVLAVAASVAAAGNMLDNPGFDGTLEPWILRSSGTTSETYDSEDAGGAPDSGSARIANLYELVSTLWTMRSACFPVTAGREYGLAASFRALPGQAVTGGLNVAVEWYSTADCATWLTLTEAPDVDAVSWTRRTLDLVAPVGAVSARVSLRVRKDSDAGMFEGLADDVWFGEPILLEDGFESGDLSAWSAASP